MQPFGESSPRQEYRSHSATCPVVMATPSFDQHPGLIERREDFSVEKLVT